MQPKSDIIKEYGQLSKEVYDNSNFSVGHTVESDDLDSTYIVLGISTDFNYNSGFQGILLENNAPKEGESKYVIAFRGTEPDQGLAEAYKDLIVADIQQYKGVV